ncbi:toll-Interleukin receptor [Variovorax sp. LG9.2]|uniref:toll-Interleukin receptor n=1 Tax=Variovorax sp. LG9.2 TaxID=3048626 RepID=UPI002B2328AA|nr:toll-Interleukin receptor [Variovorax sp. LG9.2]MEB0060187.1 toll-Interleukin receptor [Variovorax sp. LG9.2]
MNVFISWSGARSHAVAQVLKAWVEVVIQAAKPWLSSSDIDRGALWMGDINQRLQESTVGIFCLTHENRSAPWILFEAGAVAKGVHTSRICTLLIDLETTDISGPLGQFNHTRPTRDDMLKLAKSLNRALGDLHLEDAQLIRSFDAHWEKFEADFARALTEHPYNVEAAEPPRTDDVLVEILNTVRSLGSRLASVESTLREPAPSRPLPRSLRDGFESELPSGTESAEVSIKYGSPVRLRDMVSDTPRRRVKDLTGGSA